MKLLVTAFADVNAVADVSLCVCVCVCVYACVRVSAPLAKFSK